MSHPFTDVDEKKKAAALHMLRSMDPMRSTMINVCLAALDLVYVHGVERDEIVTLLVELGCERNVAWAIAYNKLPRYTL